MADSCFSFLYYDGLAELGAELGLALFQGYSKVKIAMTSTAALGEKGARFALLIGGMSGRCISGT